MKALFEATRFIEVKDSTFPFKRFKSEVEELITDADTAIDIESVKTTIKATLKIEIAEEREP
jgi:hypothetical protein